MAGWLGVPWMVGGGAEHQAEIGRALAYAQANGGEGVGGVSDCKVMASTVADNQIHVQPGVVTLLNRYGGGVRQSYVGMCQEATSDTVPATTSSGARSDLVVARVVDPQYGGATPADLQDGPYFFTEVIANVPSTTKRFSQLGLAYPAVELARIDRPSSTATVAQSQIVDLRKLTRPRRESFLFVAFPAENEFHVPPAQTSYEGEASASFHPSIEIPVWANRLQGIIMISNIAASGGNSFGRVRAKYSDGAGLTGYWGQGVWDTNNDFAVGDAINFDVNLALPAFDITAFQGKTMTWLLEALSIFPQMTATAFSREAATITFDGELFEAI